MDNKALLDEGEGALKGDDYERKSPRDFALWKKSKGGEPRWQSPWGEGRPGWHIECSAMATDVLGEVLDIHTGGEDLKFPHHDNEMAQACAFHTNRSNDYFHKQWVNYWFHAGHLHIQGLKMSKSLKNFITIREALDMNTPRQIRLLFLLQSWNTQMDYSDGSISETKAKERTLTEFFQNVAAIKRAFGTPDILAATTQVPTQMEKDLNQVIMDKQLQVDAALRDNFNYPAAMKSIFELIGEVNKYVSKCDRDENAPNPNVLLVDKSAKFITDMLKIFGVISGEDNDFMGTKQRLLEEKVAPILDIIAHYRHEITQAWREKKSKDELNSVAERYSKVANNLVRDAQNTSYQTDVDLRVFAQILENFDTQIQTAIVNDSRDEIIQITDHLRDQILPQYGAKLDDSSKRVVWKLYDVQYLRDIERDAERAKWSNVLLEREKEYNSWVKKSQDPATLYKGSDLYTQFDNDGIPTHDKEGKEISKKQAKKLKKGLDNQVKEFKKFQEKLTQEPNFMTQLEQEIKELKAKLE